MRPSASVTASTSADDAFRHLVGLALHRGEQLAAGALVCRGTLAQPDVERRLERGILRQRGHRGPHVLLAPRFHALEHLLGRREVVGHRLPHLLADANAQHREDRAKHERHRQERRHQRARDQPRRSHLAGSSTGSVKLTSVVWPGANGDAIAPLADPFVPRHQRVLARRHAIDRKRPLVIGNHEPPMIEHAHHRAHLRMDVAEHLDDAGLREHLRARRAGREPPEIEVRAARQREHVVEERIVVGKRHATIRWSPPPRAARIARPSARPTPSWPPHRPGREVGEKDHHVSRFGQRLRARAHRAPIVGGGRRSRRVRRRQLDRARHATSR